MLGGRRVGWVRERTPVWKSDVAAMKVVAELNPETDSKKTGQMLYELFENAATRGGKDTPTDEQRKSRNFETYESLREYFTDKVSPTDGFNVCFPKSYETPNVGSIGQQVIFAIECHLVQKDGPSVAELRKDPLVMKHLDAKGQLIAGDDPLQLQKDLNGAFYRIDPKNAQRSLYPEAQGLLEKALRSWEKEARS